METIKVSFNLPVSELSYINLKNQTEVEPGTFDIMISDIKKKNNVILPYEESYAESLGKSWDDLTYNQKKWAYTKRNKNILIGLADDATFSPEGIVVLNDNQEAY